MALFAVPIFHMKNKKTYDGSPLTEAESDNVICSFLKLTALRGCAVFRVCTVRFLFCSRGILRSRSAEFWQKSENRLYS